jgi:ubiquitin C-terminal hydrolase
MRNDSFLMDLFCGQLKSHVTCRRCGYLSKAFDPFMDLSLSLKGDSVEDCLAQFMDPEPLQGAERFFCPSCKCQVDSTRKLSVYRWPEVLVIHLKRFSYLGYASKKLNNDVAFSRSMDLSPFADADSKPEWLHYRLYAVVHHIGGASGGHYTASCTQQSSDPTAAWHCFDDATVQPLPAPPLHGSTPYILFFTRSQPGHRPA